MITKLIKSKTKKHSPFRRCCVVIEHNGTLESDETHTIIVYSNFKITLEYLTKKFKIKGKDKLKYSSLYRKLSQYGFIEIKIPNRYPKAILIYHCRINTNLNQPHKQLTIK